MVDNILKVNIWKVLDDCITRGIDGGWNRAHKHEENPGEDTIKEQIAHYIGLEISEYFKFDE